MGKYKHDTIPKKVKTPKRLKTTHHPTRRYQRIRRYWRYSPEQKAALLNVRKARRLMIRSRDDYAIAIEKANEVCSYAEIAAALGLSTPGVFRFLQKYRERQRKGGSDG